MKRIINLTVICALLFVFLMACSNDEKNEAKEIDVKSITFAGIPANDTLSLMKGDTYTLQVVTDPPNAPVRFYSGTSDAFRITQNTGEIAATRGGFGTVIAIAPNGDTWTKAYCVVNVTEWLEKITLNPAQAMQIISLNGTRNVNSYFSVGGYWATNKTLNYQSSIPEIATVDQATGLVTSVSTGLTEITAYAIDGSGLKSDPIQLYSGYTTTALPRTNPAWVATASSMANGTNYTPARAIDGNTTSTTQYWQPNTSNPHPHYFQVDMGIARTFNEMQIYRRSNQTHTRDVEIYIIPEDVTTEDGVIYSDERYELWGSISFGDEPTSVSSKIYRSFPKSSVTARYFMLKFLNSNSGNNQSLVEVIPRFIEAQ